MKIFKEVSSKCLGICVVTLLALTSRLIYQHLVPKDLKNVFGEILIAIVLGLLINSVIKLPKTLDVGFKFCVSKLLRFGIILMGLRLSIQDVIGTGLKSLLLILTCIILVALLTFLFMKTGKTSKRLMILIGVGTAICGNSAIIATAPVIEAKSEETSLAIATITLFGLLAVIMYPVIGTQLELSNLDFGYWAGTAINDTSQVIAASSAYSWESQNIATVVKLVRNSLMIPIVLITGSTYNYFKNKKQNFVKEKTPFTSIIPWFVFGFLVMSIIRSIGVYKGLLPQDVNNPGILIGEAQLLKTFDAISKFLILMALSAVGLNTKIVELKRTGLTPLFIGLLISSILSMVSLYIITRFL